ncbi:hypothetical protein E2562_020736, partial [Oryza meyeriana var. granulata]
MGNCMNTAAAASPDTNLAGERAFLLSSPSFPSDARLMLCSLCAFGNGYLFWKVPSAPHFGLFLSFLVLRELEIGLLF